MPEKRPFERLPADVSPINYSLCLKPDLLDFTFEGKLEAAAQVRRPSGAGGELRGKQLGRARGLGAGGPGPGAGEAGLGTGAPFGALGCSALGPGTRCGERCGSPSGPAHLCEAHSPRPPALPGLVVFWERLEGVGGGQRGLWSPHYVSTS